METLKNNIKNSVYHIALWAGLIAGFVYGISGALNITLFVLWLVSLLSFAFLVPDTIDEMKKSWKPSKLKIIWKTSYTGMVIFLAWFGAFATAAVLVVGMTLYLYAERKINGEI